MENIAYALVRVDFGGHEIEAVSLDLWFLYRFSKQKLNLSQEDMETLQEYHTVSFKDGAEFHILTVPFV